MNQQGKLKLAELAGGRGRRMLPTRGWPTVECKCGWSVRRDRYRKTCAKCKSPMPPKPPFLCRLCGEPCPGRRYSWCSDECMESYFLATDSNWLRVEVLRRDNGICASCGIDTIALRRRIAQMKRDEWLEAVRVLQENGFNFSLHGSSYNLWDADHIEPLDEGGSWELSNVQTLCHPCHKDKTSEQAARRGKQQRLLGKKWKRTQEMLRLSQGATQ